MASILKLRLLEFFLAEPYKSVVSFLIKNRLTKFPVDSLEEIPKYLRSYAFLSSKDPELASFFVALFKAGTGKTYPLVKENKNSPSVVLEPVRVSELSENFLKMISILSGKETSNGKHDRETEL